MRRAAQAADGTAKEEGKRLTVNLNEVGSLLVNYDVELSLVGLLPYDPTVAARLHKHLPVVRRVRAGKHKQSELIQ